MALHVRKAKKPKKLTKEQKKLVHAQPKENAGAGWGRSKGTNPKSFEEGWSRGRG